MDFAAVAVVASAPPPRAPEQPVQADAPGEGFSELVQAAARDEASDDASANEGEAASTQPARGPKKTPAEETDASLEAAAAAMAPVESPAPAALINLIASLSGMQASTSEDAASIETPAQKTEAPSPHEDELRLTAPTAPQAPSPEGEAVATPGPQATVNDQALLGAALALTASAPQSSPPASPAAPAPDAPLLAVLHTPQRATAPASRDPAARLEGAVSGDVQADGSASAKAAESKPVDDFKSMLKAMSTDGGKAAPAGAERQDSTLSTQQSAPPTPLPTPAGSPADVVQQTQHMRAAPAAAQVAQEIVRRFDGGATHFELRLDPPELGRVEVRLEVSRDHRVTATVTADNPQALAELARHGRDLQETLQSAGLQLSDDGLSFDLRQGGERAADAQDRQDGASNNADDDATTTAVAPSTARLVGFERWRAVRVDISV